MNTPEIPLSLYLHLPWCVEKCPYCDFNSHRWQAGRDSEQDYTKALIKDLEFSAPLAQGRSIDSIFFGGGTPSLFSVASIEALLDSIQRLLRLDSQLEITLEANPGTAEAAKFHGYRQVGVNRLSLGIQSFDHARLQALGRIHDGDEALRAVQLARQAGFEQLNLDIMYGLPGQSADQALLDLNTAIDCAPSHISWYELTLEPNTLFYSQPPVLPEEEILWQMQTDGQTLLADHGFTQYEVSAYGSPCRHNLNYWQFADYLGVGAGAHGKITDIHSGRVQRQARVKVPQRYLQRAGDESVLAEQRLVQGEERVFEFMLNALRLNDGFDGELFEQRTGLALAAATEQLQSAVDQGLLHWQADRVKTTAKGRRYLNNLLALFLPDKKKKGR